MTNIFEGITAPGVSAAKLPALVLENLKKQSAAIAESGSASSPCIS